MTARSKHRGHRIEWVGHKWVYTDWSDPTLHRYGSERPCTACGKRSRDHAPDACLGKLPSVQQACCGHGHPEDAFFIFHDGTELRGADAVRLRSCWIETCVASSDVIEMYLKVRDAETTYRLCQMCNIGVVTVPALIWVLDTFRQNSLDIAPFCDILEVYSDRNTNSGDTHGIEPEGDHEHSTSVGHSQRRPSGGR